MTNKTKLFLGSTLTALSLLGGVSCEASSPFDNTQIQIEIGRLAIMVLNGNTEGVEELATLAVETDSKEERTYAVNALKNLGSLSLGDKVKAAIDKNLQIIELYIEGLNDDSGASVSKLLGLAQKGENRHIAETALAKIHMEGNTEAGRACASDAFSKLTLWKIQNGESESYNFFTNNGTTTAQEAENKYFAALMWLLNDPEMDILGTLVTIVEAMGDDGMFILEGLMERVQSPEQKNKIAEALKKLRSQK